MERESVTFPEALEILARRANLEIPQRITGRSAEQENTRGQLFEVLQWAENQFHSYLMEAPQAAPALSYLRDRGFTDEMINRFRLGYHPDDWTWLLNKASGIYSPRILVQSRLCGEKNGRQYDNFVHRVLFPIHNERGQAVSFGGRILPGVEGPKYWNGPESSVFHKSRLLYGLNHSRDAIREHEFAIVVEGYTDCIACQQYGVTNVVGTLGTALTDSHVTALKRFARKVVLVFDGDAAGQAAASRAVETFLAQDVDLRILTLPENLDPADFLASQGADAFRSMAEQAPEAWQFRLQASLSRHGISTVDGRQQVLEEMVKVLSIVPKMSASVREGFLIANLSQRLSVSEDAVRDRLRDVRGQNSYRQRDRSPEFDPSEGNETTDEPVIEESAIHPRLTDEVARLISGKLSPNERVERDLLETILAAPDSIRFIADACSDQPLSNPVFEHLLRLCFQQAAAGGDVSPAGLLDRVSERELRSLIVWIDEQSRAKEIARKIEESKACENGCPQLIQLSIDNITRRRDDESHQNVAIQLSQPMDGTPQLDEETETLLREAAEYHQRRATKNPPF